MFSRCRNFFTRTYRRWRYKRAGVVYVGDHIIDMSDKIAEREPFGGPLVAPIEKNEAGQALKASWMEDEGTPWFPEENK